MAGLVGRKAPDAGLLRVAFHLLETGSTLRNRHLGAFDEIVPELEIQSRQDLPPE
jgi:hypothetical protein